MDPRGVWAPKKQKKICSQNAKIFTFEHAAVGISALTAVSGRNSRS